MTDTASHLLKRLEKRAKNGARGYPVGTRAFYGPDDHRASKMVAAIVEREGAEPSWMQKWHSDTGTTSARAGNGVGHRRAASSV